MKERDKQAVLANFYSCRERYEKVAAEVRRLFDRDIDPSVPDGAIYTITHRLKGDDRLLDKIADRLDRHPDLSVLTYADFIDDLLGMRIVCLRLADVDKVELFVKGLEREGKLAIQKGPERKQTFLLRLDPRGPTPPDLDLQYSGYSSIHYVIHMGDTSGLPQPLCDLKVELQVRTILEEAWGEIDHKYRYERSRRQLHMPEHVDRGFYSFAAYLQAAALHAEYLCQEIEKLAESDELTAGILSPAPSSTTTAADVATALSARFGFRPSDRVGAYIARRLRGGRFKGITLDEFRDEILTEVALEMFQSVYYDVSGRSAFEDPDQRDLDALNATLFALNRRDGDDVALSRLRSLLEGRFVGLLYRLSLQHDDETETYDMRLRQPPTIGHQIDLGSDVWVVESTEVGDDGVVNVVCRRVADGDEPTDS